MFAITLPDQSSMIHALIATLIIGASAPLVGTFIVQRRLGLLGDGLGHVAAAGVGLALWLNFAPLPIAVITTVVASCTLEWIFHSTKSSDTALTLIFYSGIAFAAIFAGNSGDEHKFEEFLFGSLSNITTSELITIGTISLAVSLIIISLYKLLLAIAIDESSAIISRVPTHVLHVVLMSSVAIIISLSMTITGLLLIAAVMVVPVMSAIIFSNTFLSTWINSIILGVTGSILGLIFSWIFNSAPGGTIVLTHIFLYTIINLIFKQLKTKHHETLHDVHNH